MSLAETRRKIDPQIPISELPISDRFAGFKQGLNGIKKAKMELFAEGERALSGAVSDLLVGARGIEVDGHWFNKAKMIRQPLILPDRNRGYAFDGGMPEELSGLIESINSAQYNLKTSGELWFDVPRVYEHADDLRIVGSFGEEHFELGMEYKRQSSYYLTPHRPDHDIVSFNGNHSDRFQRDIDRFKELNRADANTKVSVALALVKFVADCRQPQP